MARSVYNRNAKEHKIQSQFMFSLDMFTNVKRKERQQPIKEPSLQYYPFFCSMCLRLYEIAIYLWLGSIGGTTEFQFAFVVKLDRIVFF